MAIAREIGDRVGEARACWNLGVAYSKTGDLTRAVKLAQVLVDYYHEIGHADADKCAAIVEVLRSKIR